MRTSIRERLLIIALLLCKLVTAQFAFESMAMAANSSSVSPATMSAQPCPEHEHGQNQPAKTTHDESKNGGSCKSGACKCPCAHTPALAMTALIPSTPLLANREPAFYAEPSPSSSATSFFRPPIPTVA